MPEQPRDIVKRLLAEDAPPVVEEAQTLQEGPKYVQTIVKYATRAIAAAKAYKWDEVRIMADSMKATAKAAWKSEPG